MMQIKQLQLRKTVFNCFNNICFSDTFFSKSESPQEKESLGKSVKHLVESLSKFIINGLVCFVLSTSTALAMSPAPPAPAPSPIPPIDPTPGTPQLAIELIQTKIILEWNGTQHAQYYPVYAYTEGQWQHIENIYGTRAFYDLERRGWDSSELAFKILACKRPNFLTVCSAYSNTVQLKDYLPPQAPNLSLATENNKISLTWDSVYRAQYYQIEIYKQYNWHPLITVSSTNYNSAYQNDWDLDDVEFRVKACDSSNACGNYSDSIKLSDQLPLVSPSFGLSSYPQTLLSGSLGLIDEASELAFDERKEMTRYIVATLRLTDSNTQAVQDIDWPIYIDTSDFTVTSNKTISVRPGNYNIAFLAVDGNVTYVARALNVTLSETEQNIPLELKTVLGDTNVSIDAVIPLPEFKFQYDPEELTDFTQPKLSVLIDDGDEVLLTLNPDTGITDQYLSISPGPHNIRLRFYDGALLKGGSDPDQEDVNIVPAEPFEMDLIPLKGKTTASLDMVGGEAVFNFAIPAVVINEVGGNPDDLRVLLSLVGLNNQPENVVLSNLTYNSSSNNYEAEHTFTGMQADTQMTLSLSFTDLSTEPDQLLGTCVVGSFVLNSEPRTTPCQLTLRRRAIVGGHLMAVLGINVFDANYAPVRGVSVYARRLGLDTQNDTNEDNLGTLLGLTGSGTFGTSGYLEAYLVKGNYELTAKYVPVDGTAQETISLKAFDVKNQDLVLDKEINQNQAPSINITAPAANATVDASYTISWTASDSDNQANISLYYDTDNSGYDGTLITSSLSEGTHSSYTWNTSSLPSGNYYIYAKIDDGVNPSVYDYGAGKITVNRAPGITITAPATHTVVDASYTIGWTASDPDNQASISLYYDTNNSDYDGTLITNSLSEGIHTSYDWSTAAIPEGDYYIYAVISDGINQVKAYSARPLTIGHNHGLAVDVSGALNNYGGLYNAPSFNYESMALLNPTDGSIHAWGHGDYGGTGAPTDSGYTKIYSNAYAFAALKADGSIKAWGDADYGGTGAPTDSGYTKIYSSAFTFAALKADGSITAWGNADSGGTGAPTDSGYTKIYSNAYAFAALKADGSITVWGYTSGGAPTDSGYTKIYSSAFTFAALKADGSITAWGNADSGGTGAPTDSGYTKIYSTAGAFAALKADGSISAWGWGNYGGVGAPTDSGYTKIYSNMYAFAALKADGSITAWGDADSGGTGAPTDSGYTKIYSNAYAFAALKADGSITAWGAPDSGSTRAPTDNGYTKIYSNAYAFAALKADGSITAWGDADSGGTGAPTNSGYISIYSTSFAFIAIKADGTVFTWGDPEQGGSDAPSNLNDTPNLNQSYSLKPNDKDIPPIYSAFDPFSAIKADGRAFNWGNPDGSGSGAGNLNDNPNLN
jgi:alpha-tubulin suppressor-like RCC1 family protein